ncbi:MAG: type III polyketide synthase [Cyclobacteriaceae bacterium]
MSTYIKSIGTALPLYSTEQSRIADFMVRHLKLNEQEERNLRILYRASGIQNRYSVLEDFGRNLNGQSFFREDATFPTAKPRMDLYQKHALSLAVQASKEAINDAGITMDSITHVITISCTGMYAPGLDIELIEELSLKTNTKRTSINFMGCYASFNGLKMADQIIRSEPESNVLMVCVELCTIHLQDKKDEENLLANAIFGDGAAALIINSKEGKRSLKVQNFYSDLALSGKKEMGWYIGDYGFEMKLSPRVPDVIKEGIEELTTSLLSHIQLDLSDIDYFAIHPGGKRILEVIEEKLHITKEQNRFAREALRSFGNMSSPTVLFVIKSIMEDVQSKDNGKHLLSFAFGPGLTLESAVLQVRCNA